MNMHYQAGHPSSSSSSGSGSGTSVVVEAVSELTAVLLGVGVVDGEATALVELAADETEALDATKLENENEAGLGVGVLIAAVDTADELDEVIATACEEEEELEAATVEYEVEQAVVAGSKN